jgi:pimeloyl-ACP methyl ester carboxylesterase
VYVGDHGQGTPVLLIHGWPDSARLWRHQIPFLTGHGFRVIAPDMRGSGGPAARPRWPTTRWPMRVGDVAGILDTLGIEAAHGSMARILPHS